jgi:uncharacterized protein (DUF1330 family)
MLPLDEQMAAFEERAIDLLVLNEALEELEHIAPRQADIIELRFFAGLSSEQAARDWFDDPDYQAISEHRRAGTSMRFLTMVHGLPPRK